MVTLREAAQKALEALEKPNAGLVPHNGEWMSIQSIAITALKAALAEPVQEPVAWMDIDENGNRLTVRQWSDGNREEVPLYIAPPQRKPLSDDEITQAMYRADAIFTGPMQFRFAREIERAHGIKENT